MSSEDSIAILGPFTRIFWPIFDPKLGPGHLKITKTWHQYIYFYLLPKLGPNIFILRQFLFISWDPILRQFWKCHPFKYIGSKNKNLSRLVRRCRAFWLFGVGPGLIKGGGEAKSSNNVVFYSVLVDCTPKWHRISAHILGPWYRDHVPTLQTAKTYLKRNLFED